MKKIYSQIIIHCLLFFNVNLSAQQTLPHQPEHPPVNPGYPFSRGIYVDCTDKIIFEISTGETMKLQKELYDYIGKNYISHIILCGLEHSYIFGNPTMESALRSFMIKTRALFPGIKIGLSGSDSGDFQSTASVIIPPQFDINCLPRGAINTINNLKDALNDFGPNSVNLKKAELSKFFFRAAQYGNFTGPFKYSRQCSYAFDSFYLEYRYWNKVSSLAEMQNEFSNFKTILSVMKILKCNYSCINNVDAEFLPTEFFNLQAWTAIDQITEADPLADRLMIPVFTNNAAGVYDKVCKTLHFLSDRFSKPNSTIFLELSAESSSFSYCNSSAIPGDYLGDYLNGVTSPSGNMYSVEKMFLDKFNDPNYMCSLCSCRSYNDNHFSSTYPSANSLAGVMWEHFSMLKKQNIFKEAQTSELDFILNKPLQIQLFDFSGRLIRNYSSIEESNKWENDGSLKDGIYFLKIIYSDDRQVVRKIVRVGK